MIFRKYLLNYLKEIKINNYFKIQFQENDEMKFLEVIF